jgi:hypothetical protein
MEEEFHFDFDSDSGDDDVKSVNQENLDDNQENLDDNQENLDDDISQLKKLLLERKIDNLLSKYTFNTSDNRYKSMSNLLTYFNTGNKPIVHIFYNFIQGSMSKHFQNVDSKNNKTSKNNVYIIETRKKNFLFNCIRNQLLSPRQDYKSDYNKYFKKIQVLPQFTNKLNKIAVINKNICPVCGSDNVIIADQLITCRTCGAVTQTEATGTSFMTGGNVGSIGGTAAVQLTKGGKKFFLSDNELGNEGLIDRIVKYITDYFETRPESDEFVSSVIESFKTFARRQIATHESYYKLISLDLKLKAINIIVNKDPSFFQNKFEYVIDLLKSFKIDNTLANTIIGPDIFKDIILVDLSSKISDKWKTEQLNLFNNIILKLILASNNKLIGKWKINRLEDLSITQIAALYYLIVNINTKITQKEVANIFNINNLSKISEDIDSFKVIMSSPKAILPGIKQRLNLK